MKKIIYLSYLLLLLAFLYLPILLLTVYSFTDSVMIGSIRKFSLKNYHTLFYNPELRAMVLGTLAVALVVACLSTILGTFGAIAAFYSSRRKRRYLELMNNIPVINADIVTGFSVCVLLIVFLRMDKETYLPLIIGLSTLCTPFVYLSVYPRLKQMDGQTYEAALDLGCPPWKAIFVIILPQIVSGILSGFMISITLTLDDYFISTYTKPATFDTISTYVVNATKGAMTEIKTALWALSALMFLIVLVIILLLGRKPQTEGREW